MAPYIAIIPARAGSKGVPGKNLRELGGKPLVVWSIEASLACRNIARTIVSTDSEEIARVARGCGAEVPFLRPAALATDSAATEPVMLHALGKLEESGEAPGALVLLQPTSPLRLAGSLDRAVAEFERHGADSLLSVSENHHFFWKRGAAGPEALYDFRNRPRRQDIPADARWYRENGSIYITRSHVLRSEKNRLGGRIAMHVMTEAESWEIDSAADFQVVEGLMRGHGVCA